MRHVGSSGPVDGAELGIIAAAAEPTGRFGGKAHVLLSMNPSKGRGTVVCKIGILPKDINEFSTNGCTVGPQTWPRHSAYPPPLQSIEEFDLTGLSIMSACLNSQLGIASIDSAFAQPSNCFTTGRLRTKLLILVKLVGRLERGVIAQ